MITAKDPNNLKWVVNFNHLTDRQKAVVAYYNAIVHFMGNTPNDSTLGAKIRTLFQEKDVVVLGNNLYKESKTPCTCECHSSNETIVHFTACCNNEEVVTYLPLNEII